VRPGLLKGPIETTCDITLESGDSVFSLEFSALHYAAPARNRYAWRLEPFDDGWTESDASRRQLAYAKLPPGDYVLRLRGSNRDGVWAEPQLALPLRVLPAWYQTLWFRILCAALLVAALAGLMRLRLAALRNRQRELEIEVAGRTADLREQKRALVEANKQLAISADTLRRLGEIGRDITAHLDASAVFQALDRHVGRLVGSSLVQVYRAGASGALELAHGAPPPTAPWPSARPRAGPSSSTAPAAPISCTPRWWRANACSGCWWCRLPTATASVNA